MKIIAKAPEDMSLATLYALTRGQSRPMKEMEGAVLDVVAWALAAKEGDVQVLSIVDGSGAVYATISATFIDEFRAIVELCAEYQQPLERIGVIGGETKKGRRYITCKMI